MKVLHSICQQIWKTQQWPQDWKTSVFIPISEKGNAKEYSNYHTTALISHASKVKLKISKGDFNSTWTVSFQMFKLDLEKAEEPELKLSTSIGSSKKQEHSRKTPTCALLTMPKPFTVWITTNCGKFYKRWKYQTTLPVSWEICMQVKKEWLELVMEKETGSKSGKEYVHQGCILSPYLFILYAEDIMRNVRLDEAQAEIKIVRRNISNLRYADDTTLLWQKA